MSTGSEYGLGRDIIGRSLHANYTFSVDISANSLLIPKPYCKYCWYQSKVDGAVNLLKQYS